MTELKPTLSVIKLSTNGLKGQIKTQKFTEWVKKLSVYKRHFILKNTNRLKGYIMPTAIIKKLKWLY